jgi:hypothetical protein
MIAEQVERLGDAAQLGIGLIRLPHQGRVIPAATQIVLRRR